MRLLRHADVRDFFDVTGAWLAEEEAEGETDEDVEDSPEADAPEHDDAELPPTAA